MDQNLPARAGGSGPLASSGPADPPGPLDYRPPGYPLMPNPAHSAFWDDQGGWDGQADWDDRLDMPDRSAGHARSAGHDRCARRDRAAGRDRTGWHDGHRNQVSAATYWRRRAIALVIGLAVLGVITWAVDGVLGGGKPTSLPAGPAGTHSHSHGGAEDLSDSHVKAHGKATGRHRAHAGNTAGLGARHGAGAQPAAATTSAVTDPGLLPPACAPGSVVLTLRSPRYWYVPRAQPVFVVEAVSTANGPCTFDLGARFVSVVVTSGPATIWNSASCVPAPGSRPVVLRRGVPAFFRVTWDRRASSLGCRGRGDVAHPGTYTAVAFDAHQRSQTMVFVLSGRGVAVP